MNLSTGRDITFSLLMLFYLITVMGCGVPEQQTEYESSWESLTQHRVPDWFDDAKFGIFIHWGVYSVPAYDTEWYPRHMYRKGSDIFQYHVENYGHPSEFGYKDFIPEFTAENWDPEEWAELFQQAGARYVVPTAEHHDGFAMWDSDLTEWDAMDKGPHRDIIGELEQAVRARGMKYAPSYHRAFNWYYYTCADDYDTCDPQYSGLYSTPHPDQEHPTDEWLRNWKARWEEIRDRYQPDFLWFDFGWGETAFHPYAKEIIAEYYNLAQEWGKEVAVVNKTIRRPPMIPEEVGDFIELDHMRMDTISLRKWESPTYIGGGSWAYNQAASPEEYKSTNELVDMLVDIVSKNGNLLLDVGPKADGTIIDIERDRLLKIGQWLDVNGEAIFDTDYWTTYGEENVRFTRKGRDVLYAIALEWPGESLTLSTLKSLAAEDVRSVELLGNDELLEWSMTSDGIQIMVPEEKPCNHAFSFKITLEIPVLDIEL